MPIDVLIIGAGPTGLVLALWLTKLGVGVRIIDKTVEPGTTSRALAVHARTLELYRQLDLTDTVVAKGHKVPGANLWVKGKKEARIAFEDVGSDLTPFPFLHIFPQDQHERLLVDRLEKLGIQVERRTELLSYEDAGDRVMARIRRADGTEEDCEAAYIAGCDGARSIVRQAMKIGFPGGTYQQMFYVADIEASGPPMDGELHVDLDQADFLAIFPLAGGRAARLIGTVREDALQPGKELKFEDVNGRAISHLKVNIEKVNWFSTYHVHHRVSEHFRKGRAFLLGDAAHIHSPAGGQGMNTGIGDAINLAWKLQMVLAGRAPDRLLDSYEAERIEFARRLVKTTDKIFTFVTAEGKLANIIRTRLVPIIAPSLTHFEAWREWMFRTVSQLAINYRECALNDGNCGEVHGGDRLPWLAADGNDNYTSLRAMTWQVHVYGTPRAGLSEWCEEGRLPLHVFPWRDEYRDVGLGKDGVYLIRPDTYVAVAETKGSPTSFQRYFDEHDLRI